MALPESGLVNN